MKSSNCAYFFSLLLIAAAAPAPGGPPRTVRPAPAWRDSLAHSAALSRFSKQKISKEAGTMPARPPERARSGQPVAGFAALQDAYPHATRGFSVLLLRQQPDRAGLEAKLTPAAGLEQGRKQYYAVGGVYPSWTGFYSPAWNRGSRGNSFPHVEPGDLISVRVMESPHRSDRQRDPFYFVKVLDSGELVDLSGRSPQVNFILTEFDAIPRQIGIDESAWLARPAGQSITIPAGSAGKLKISWEKGTEGLKLDYPGSFPSFAVYRLRRTTRSEFKFPYARQEDMEWILGMDRLNKADRRLVPWETLATPFRGNLFANISTRLVMPREGQTARPIGFFSIRPTFNAMILVNFGINPAYSDQDFALRAIAEKARYGIGRIKKTVVYAAQEDVPRFERLGFVEVGTLKGRDLRRYFQNTENEISILVWWPSERGPRFRESSHDPNVLVRPYASYIGTLDAALQETLRSILDPSAARRIRKVRIDGESILIPQDPTDAIIALGKLIKKRTARFERSGKVLKVSLIPYRTAAGLEQWKTGTVAQLGVDLGQMPGSIKLTPDSSVLLVPAKAASAEPEKVRFELWVHDSIAEEAVVMLAAGRKSDPDTFTVRTVSEKKEAGISAREILNQIEDPIGYGGRIRVVALNASAENTQDILEGYESRAYVTFLMDRATWGRVNQDAVTALLTQPILPAKLIINLTAGEIPTVKVTIDGTEDEYYLFV